MSTHDSVNPAMLIESRRTLYTMLLDVHVTLPDHITHDAVLAHHLAEVLDALPVKRLAVCWPTQGEFDTPAVLGHWLAIDATRHTLLPVVTSKFSPLQLRRQTPDYEMTSGAHNIPIPRSGEMETPGALPIPYVGSDTQRYRIGYGDGFYDRTLTALHAAGHRPRTIGVAYKVNRVEPIASQPHDIMVNYIVTERGVF